ncbi:MAG: hypothetical protein KJ573_01335 [Proteobacteria bacterium]|nr:hypothetical protein [Pseudomonadota bacterium]MBU1902217.1 hypothetical protein [Pseudomonadota bacterium]
MKNLRDIQWSKTEKRVARKAFDTAYKKECASITKQAFKLLDVVKEPNDIWKVHDLLTTKREEVDRKYDYRYSVLILVFSTLIKEGWLKIEDLAGLSDEKLVRIKTICNL